MLEFDVALYIKKECLASCKIGIPLKKGFELLCKLHNTEFSKLHDGHFLLIRLHNLIDQ